MNKSSLIRMKNKSYFMLVLHLLLILNKFIENFIISINVFVRSRQSLLFILNKTLEVFKI